MAITINGSGTITGISTGGLPDGIVDDGTLASSAVTSTKIADGTITNSDINASAAIAASKLSGTGKVLQVVSATSNGATASSTTSFVATTLGASITPSSSTSKILVIAHGYVEASGSSVHGIATIYRNSTTNLGQSYGMGNIYSASGGYNESTFSCNYLDSPSTTASTNYKVYCRQGGSGTMKFGAGSRLASITLMEIGA